ncbi:MAG: pyridoxamine 5'-phosphate oxidase family protein, partial [Ilumatobacteraceae bacterium]
MSPPFTHVIESEAELRDLYRMPHEGTKMKIQGNLDSHARTFIEASPFILVGTTSPDGTGDVSPKGGPPGFVVVLDDNRIA